ncbi:MAG: hypothetical protein KDC71_24150, partial [Acidobacteria bacterium]|nr:hypothetical protein [Acidobacteriota bacterium]
MRVMCVFWVAICLWAQDPAPPVSKEKEAEKREEQLTLELLRQAEQQIKTDRQNMVNREKRMELLLKELKTDVETSEKNEQATLDALKRARAEWEQLKTSIPEVPAELIAHYESRDPKIAAADFSILYKQDKRVAIALIKSMKKKKSAALIDQLAILNASGKEIAAEIAAAIGS